MAWALKNWTSGQLSSPLTIDVSSLSIAANDFVVVALCNATATATVAPPSALGGDASGSAHYPKDESLSVYSNGTTGDTNLITFSGIATGADTTLSAGTSFGAAVKEYLVLVFTGIDGTTPQDATVVQATGISSDLANPGSITTATANACVLAIYAACQVTSSVAWTLPSSGVTNSGQAVSSAARFARIGFATFDRATAGAFDPPAVTGGEANTSDSWSAVTYALRPAATAVTHATSGALSGQIGSVAGSSARTREHAASGTLAGQGASVGGAAARFRAFAASGALTANSAAIAGSAARSVGPVTHAASGALTGQGTAVSGASIRFRVMATSGALAGQASSLSGASARTRQHAATGSLLGVSSSLAGTGLRFRALNTTGSLVGAASAVSGQARRFREMLASGQLAGVSSLVDGGATRSSLEHRTEGSLSGSGSGVAGSAVRTPNPNPWHVVEPLSTPWANTNPEAASWVVTEPAAAEFTEATRDAGTWTLTPRSSGEWS